MTQKTTGLVSLHSIHCFILLMEERCVLYEVRTEYFRKIQIRFVLQSVYIIHRRLLNLLAALELSFFNTHKF